jgi:hypothetical protein
VDPGESYEKRQTRTTGRDGTAASKAERVLSWSFALNDWRYRGSRDKITTAFFMGWHSFGFARLKADEVRAGSG